MRKLFDGSIKSGFFDSPDEHPQHRVRITKGFYLGAARCYGRTVPAIRRPNEIQNRGRDRGGPTTNMVRVGGASYPGDCPTRSKRVLYVA